MGTDESSEDGFAILGVHLKVLVSEGFPDALDQNESEVEELSVMDSQGFAGVAPGQEGREAGY